MLILDDTQISANLLNHFSVSGQVGIHNILPPPFFNFISFIFCDGILLKEELADKEGSRKAVNQSQQGVSKSVHSKLSMKSVGPQIKQAGVELLCLWLPPSPAPSPSRSLYTVQSFCNSCWHFAHRPSERKLCVLQLIIKGKETPGKSRRRVSSSRGVFFTHRAYN